MKKILVFLTALFIFVTSTSANSDSRWINCRVVAISDGDTFTCLFNNKPLKVRLQEIDAPEKSQAFGNKSRQTLARLIHKQNVSLHISGYDRYQRLLATVYNTQKQNINLLMIQLGMAWFYEKYSNNQQYLQSQNIAKQQRLGLWKDPNPIQPSQFRKNKSQGNL